MGCAGVWGWWSTEWGSSSTCASLLGVEAMVVERYLIHLVVMRVSGVWVASERQRWSVVIRHWMMSAG